MKTDYTSEVSRANGADGAYRPPRPSESGGHPADAELAAAVPSSRPLLAWQEKTPAAKAAPLAVFEIDDTHSDYWLKAEQMSDQRWWLHLQVCAGTYLPAGATTGHAKQAAINMACERLERVLAELRRGAA